jgi:Na+-driven multidrug efflux pump
MWLPAVAMLFAALIHLLLSLPLALGIGNFQWLGIRGIAISWILSSAVSMVPLAYGLYRINLIGWAKHFAWRLVLMFFTGAWP